VISVRSLVTPELHFKAALSSYDLAPVNRETVSGHPDFGVTSGRDSFYAVYHEELFPAVLETCTGKHALFDQPDSRSTVIVICFKLYTIVLVISCCFVVLDSLLFNQTHVGFVSDSMITHVGRHYQGIAAVVEFRGCICFVTFFLSAPIMHAMCECRFYCGCCSQLVFRN
jgi:hypothetical protein